MHNYKGKCVSLEGGDNDADKRKTLKKTLNKSLNQPLNQPLNQSLNQPLKKAKKSSKESPKIIPTGKNTKTLLTFLTKFLDITKTSVNQQVKEPIQKEENYKRRNDKIGYSCLHYAAVRGDLEIIKFFLSRGAKVDLVDKLVYIYIIIIIIFLEKNTISFKC